LEIGQYQIVHKIGEGTMGTVYQALHLRLKRHVALKVLKGEHLADEFVAGRFADEASITSGLRHPNIVEVLDAGTYEGTPFLVMELLEGESLSSRLTRTRLELGAVLEFAYQTTQAVEYAHRRGVIHRDLKPDNLYIVSDPRIPGHSLIKVLDFSIAKLRESGAERIAEDALRETPTPTEESEPAALLPGSSRRYQTRVGSVFGTPPYMSPEQCRGARTVDARTDVYALGIILYEMLTGRVPFEGDDVVRVLERHVTERPLDVRVLAPDVPAEVAAIVTRALAKLPDDRYQSMAEFGAALSALSFLPDLERSSVPNDNVKWGRVTPTTLTGIGAAPFGSAPGTLASVTSSPPRFGRRFIVGAAGAVLCISGLGYFRSKFASSADSTLQTQPGVVQLEQAEGSPPNLTDVNARNVPPASVSMGLAVGSRTDNASSAQSLTAETAAVPVQNEQLAKGLPPAEKRSRQSKVASGKIPRATTDVQVVTPTSSVAKAEVFTPSEPLPPAAGAGVQSGSSGKLTFDSAPWSNVYLNGKLLGSTPLLGVVLPVGTHTLVLKSPETNRKTSYVVEIKPDQTVSRFVGWESE
jgi:serine/threonine protein kinase